MIRPHLLWSNPIFCDHSSHFFFLTLLLLSFPTFLWSNPPFCDKTPPSVIRPLISDYYPFHCYYCKRKLRKKTEYGAPGWPQANRASDSVFLSNEGVARADSVRRLDSFSLIISPLHRSKFHLLSLNFTFNPNILSK